MFSGRLVLKDVLRQAGSNDKAEPGHPAESSTLTRPAYKAVLQGCSQQGLSTKLFLERLLNQASLAELSSLAELFC